MNQDDIERTLSDLNALAVQWRDKGHDVVSGYLNISAAIIKALVKERDAALAEVERLQGLNTDLDLLAKKRLTLLKHAQQERADALAEVEQLQKERNAWQSVAAERLAEVERLKATIRNIPYGDTEELKKRYDWL